MSISCDHARPPTAQHLGRCRKAHLADVVDPARRAPDLFRQRTRLHTGPSERSRAAAGGSNGASLATELEHLAERHGTEVAGEQIASVPAPIDADHLRAELLRLKGIQVRFTRRFPDPIASPQLAHRCAEVLEELLPIHRWLLANPTTPQSKG